MKHSIKITVITITFNAVTTLEKTILSVLNQNYTNIECIVIDGGSTDGTVDIIKKYADHLAYWVSEPDKGIYDAMNKGIEYATGEWINFMNAGDFFYSDCTLEKVAEALKDQSAEIVYGQVVMHFSDNEFRLCKPGSMERIKNGLPFCHQATFVRTKLMKVGFNTSFKVLGDLDFFIKQYRLNVHFHEIDIPIAVYDMINGITGSTQADKEMLRVLGIRKYLIAQITRQLKNSILNKPLRKIFRHKRLGIHCDYHNWIE